MNSHVVHIKAALITGLIVLAAYGVAIGGAYVYHDDYYLLLTSGRLCSNHPQYNAYMLDYGRPVGIAIKCALSNFFDEPTHAYVARSLTVVGVWFLSILLYFQIVKFANALAAAFIAGACVCVVALHPPISMLANAHHVWAATLGLAGGLLAAAPGSGTIRYVRLFLSGFACFLALAIYQPGAFLFVLPFVVMCLVKEVRLIRVYWWIVSLIPIGVATILYGFLYLGKGSSRFKLLADLSSKIAWFSNEALPLSLGLWDFRISLFSIVLFALSCFSLAILLILDLREKGRNAALNRIFGLFCGAFLIILSFTPNLIAAESQFFYRTALSFQLTLAVAAFILILQAVNRVHCYLYTAAVPILDCAITLLMGIFAAGGVHRAQYNVTWGYVVPATIEFNWLTHKLAGVNFSEKRNIHIIRPSGALNTLSFKDEFGRMTTEFPQDVPWVVLGAMRKLGLPPELAIVTSGSNAETYDMPGLDFPPKRTLPVPVGAIILDMNAIGVSALGQ